MDVRGPDVRPLKEKFRDHWKTRNQMFSPKVETTNKLGKLFSFLYSTALTLVQIYVIFPVLFSSPWWTYLQLFIYFGAISNWCLCLTKWPSQVTAERVSRIASRFRETDGSLPEDWKSCVVCQLDVPPRSHHCKICNVCVLKRDHHCFFTGNCVGWGNQRRFIAMVFYGMVGSLLGFVWIIYYLMNPEATWSYGWYSYIPGLSFVFWFFGYIPSVHFIVVLTLYASTAVIFIAGGFFFWELATVCFGVTSFEASRGKKKYKNRPLESLQSVFGPFGLLHFIFPFPIALTGDGMTWEVDPNNKEY